MRAFSAKVVQYHTQRRYLRLPRSILLLKRAAEAAGFVLVVSLLAAPFASAGSLPVFREDRVGPGVSDAEKNFGLSWTFGVGLSPAQFEASCIGDGFFSEGSIFLPERFAVAHLLPVDDRTPGLMGLSRNPVTSHGPEATYPLHPLRRPTPEGRADHVDAANRVVAATKRVRNGGSGLTARISETPVPKADPAPVAESSSLSLLIVGFALALFPKRVFAFCQASQKSV